MSNLEKLHLNVYATMKKTFIDGNNLNKNIVNHITQLRKFTFDIRSYLNDRNENDLPTNEDLKYTFSHFKNNEIISYIDYFPYRRSAWCTIYTYPYTRKTYYVTNYFPDVLCKSVREITLCDEQHPFEYEFFLRISQSFPFVEKLSLHNSKPQKK
jgi:hypothetical protein